MNRSTAVSSYTDAIAGLPQDAFLGSLIFFSISAADVNLENARRDLTAAGLKTGTLRKNLRPIDAFKKSTNSIKKKFPEQHDGVRSELLVRPVGEDGEQAYRHLVLERTDLGVGGKRRKLVYDKVGEVVFTRGTKDRALQQYTGHGVEARRTTQHLPYDLTEDEDQWLTEKLITFKDLYDHMLNYMDSHAVRSFVREYIYSLSGICVKESGGLYFVKQDHIDELEKLAEWVRSVGSEFHIVPLLNVGEQKAMIMEAFEDETVNEVARLMGEVQKILSEGRNIEERTFDTYALRAAELKNKVSEYNQMLDAKAGRASTELNLFGQQILALVDRIKKPTKVTP